MAAELRPGSDLASLAPVDHLGRLSEDERSPPVFGRIDSADGWMVAPGKLFVPPIQYVGSMLIDCDTCLARDAGICDDCVVSFILPMTREEAARISLEDEEVAALVALADEGLLPPLRLISPVRESSDDLAG